MNLIEEESDTDDIDHFMEYLYETNYQCWISKYESASKRHFGDLNTLINIWNIQKILVTLKNKKLQHNNDSLHAHFSRFFKKKSHLLCACSSILSFNRWYHSSLC